MNCQACLFAPALFLNMGMKMRVSDYGTLLSRKKDISGSSSPQDSLFCRSLEIRRVFVRFFPFLENWETSRQIFGNIFLLWGFSCFGGLEDTWRAGAH